MNRIYYNYYVQKQDPSNLQWVTIASFEKSYRTVKTTKRFFFWTRVVTESEIVDDWENRIMAAISIAKQQYTKGGQSIRIKEHDSMVTQLGDMVHSEIIWKNGTPLV